MSRNLVIHRFFCLNCGKESMPLPRSKGHQHGKLHRKKLYCYHCKQEINHVECKTDEDVYEFKIDFENGVFKDEAEESLRTVRMSCLG